MDTFLPQSLNVMKNMEETTLKQVEEYRKLALEEISQFQEGLNKAENELMRCKNRQIPSVTLSEEQNKFLDNRPDYIQYLKCVRNFHDRIALEEEKIFFDTRAKLACGRDVIKDTLKKFHKL